MWKHYMDTLRHNIDYRLHGTQCTWTDNRVAGGANNENGNYSNTNDTCTGAAQTMMII